MKDFIGCDAHKRTFTLQHKNQDGILGYRATIPACKDELNKFFDKFEKPFNIIIEAGRQYWWMDQFFKNHPKIDEYKIIDPMRARRLSSELAVIYGHGRAKNDKIDSEMLAEIYRLNLARNINIPNEKQLANRGICRQRFELIKQRTRVKNQIQALLETHGKRASTNKLIDSLEYFENVCSKMPEYAGFLLKMELEKIWFMNEKIDACERLLEILLKPDDKDIDILISTPGIGTVLARIILTEIVDISHFKAPKYLISYSGLAPMVQESGFYKGKVKLNRHANHYLKYAFVEAAHNARNFSKYKAKYQKDEKEHDKIIAKINLARRIAKSVFWMLTRQQYYKY